MNIVQIFEDKKKISPPKWLSTNLVYLIDMGSHAYGCNGENSDFDIFGFTIPPKNLVFRSNEIPGFGKQFERFSVWQEHHAKHPDNNNSPDYDFCIYSIVDYFNLAMNANPNITDGLFVPQRCIRHITTIGQMVRDNRKLFLHKGCFKKMRGYALSQIHKMKEKNPGERTGKRVADVEKHGYDLKFAYHTVRLCLECEQILTDHDLDLEKDREVYKAIRRGDWTEAEIYEFFNRKEKSLDELCQKSTLPHHPDEEAIKNLLLQCLEHHYGSLESCIASTDFKEQELAKAFTQIRDICNKVKCI